MPGLNRSSQQLSVRRTYRVRMTDEAGLHARLGDEMARLSSRRLARRAGRSGDSRVPAVRGGPGSGGRRRQVLVEYFGGCFPAECLARPGVEGCGDGGEVVGAVAGEVRASGEVLA